MGEGESCYVQLVVNWTNAQDEAWATHRLSSPISLNFFCLFSRRYAIQFGAGQTAIILGNNLIDRLSIRKSSRCRLRRVPFFSCHAFLSDAIVNARKRWENWNGTGATLISLSPTSVSGTRKDKLGWSGLIPVKPELNVIITDHYCEPLSVAHEGK